MSPNDPKRGPCLARPAPRQDSRATNGGAVKAKVSSYALHGCRLSRRFLLSEICFQPRDVFQEAPAGQD